MTPPLEQLDLIYHLVGDSITSKEDALNFVKEEIKVALSGCYEAKHFARKSLIKINNEYTPKNCYLLNTSQSILTNSINEKVYTRDAVHARLYIIDKIMSKYGIGKYQDNVSKQKIRSICEKRNIKKLFHFTKIENLKGILNLGLMSKDYMQNIGQKYSYNDNFRIDGQLNAISISISFPNHKMFYKYRMKDRNQQWALIVLSPSILWEEKCLFSKHNAAHKKIINISHRLQKPEDLEAMFSGINNVDSQNRRCDTEDSQAEVLVFNNICKSKIVNIVFENKKDLIVAENTTEYNSFSVDDRYFQSRNYFIQGKFIKGI